MERKNELRQIEKGLAKKHFRKLNECVRVFCQFLDRKPQPSPQEVRAKFTAVETDWKVWCVRHNLGIRASMMFNAKIAYEWETRYVRREPNDSSAKTGNKTLK